MTNTKNGGEREADSRRVFEDVCDRVRSEIAAGSLKPGDRLLAEREMAERYGIGRNAVREALRALEVAGIVQLHKGRNGGAFIRAPNSNRVTHAMRDLIDHGSLGWKDLTEARSRVLETVMELACERATAADFANLDRNLDLTEEAQDRPGGGRNEHAYEFWRLLAQSTHNTVLVLMVTSMTDLLRKFVETAEGVEDIYPFPSLVPARRRMLQHLRARASREAIAELKKQLQQIHLRIHERIARAEAAARPAGLSARRSTAPPAPAKRA